MPPGQGAGFQSLPLSGLSVSRKTRMLMRRPPSGLNRGIGTVNVFFVENTLILAAFESEHEALFPSIP